MKYPPIPNLLPSFGHECLEMIDLPGSGTSTGPQWRIQDLAGMRVSDTEGGGGFNQILTKVLTKNCTKMTNMVPSIFGHFDKKSIRCGL